MTGFAQAAATTAVTLIDQRRFDQALDLLERARARLRATDDWRHLRRALESAPDDLRAHHPGWAGLYAQCLAGSRDPAALLDFTAHLPGPLGPAGAAPLRLARAWALLARDRPLEARSELLAAIPHLEGSALGQAQRRLGYALHELGQPSEGAFDRAEALLADRDLGLCLIDRADCQRRDGDLEAARETLTRALAHLASDSYHLAWAHYNLGEWWFETHPGQARVHFIQTECLTHSREARAFRARGLHAQGSVHRLDGDWLRAEHAYRESLKCATDPDDRRAAAWSAARMQRLQGQPALALTTLEQALTAQPTPRGAIHTERAAALVMLGHETGARQALAASGYLTGRHANLRTIVTAELDRLAGDPETALMRLEGLDLSGLIAREEAVCFPDLFTFARLAGRDVPQAHHRSRRQVRVRACGVLHVTVGDQPIALDPTGRAGELLALLLEHGGHARAETLVDLLYPQETVSHRKYPALWQLAKRLRAALGWPHCLRVSRGLYHLDPDTDWHYDAEQARAQRRAQAHFLVGITSDWALEVARHLGQLDQSD